MSRSLNRFYALDDFEAAARHKLPRLIHGFIAGGSETEAGLRDNRAAFQDYAFVSRVLANVSGRSQKTTLFGQECASPFGIAPMGAGAICGYRADQALAAAAGAAGIPMVVSAAGLTSLEILRQAGSTSWFQLYVPGTPERFAPLIDRAGAAGFDTLVVSADVPVPANRENNLRNGFSLPIKVSPRVALDCAMHPGWLFGTFLRTLATDGMPHFENMDATRGPPIFSKTQVRNIVGRDELAWEHVAMMRKRWPGTLVVKGILSPDDARIARETGVDGIILSNHGGRQLDGAISAMRMLPEIVAALPGYPVMLDGGVRRGSDILKALALGAHFVFIGRPMLFAAALFGQAGVAHAIKLTQAEIDRDLALLGLRNIGQLTPGCVRKIR